MHHGHLDKYVNCGWLRSRREKRERFPHHRGLAIRHASRYVPWCLLGSLTSDLLWSWWRGKRNYDYRMVWNVTCILGQRSGGRQPAKIFVIGWFNFPQEYIQQTVYSPNVYWYISNLHYFGSEYMIITNMVATNQHLQQANTRAKHLLLISFLVS